MVDSTVGCERICMLDAYQGYHQIPLAVGDQEKVSFITATGTFYYTVMPFGLRNARAIYQRMMDRIFREKIGRNVEVYVDDILIKSPLAVNLIMDVEEIAKGGKFLGYLVTERGIEANLEKVRALRDMQIPQNLKETQKLTNSEKTWKIYVDGSATHKGSGVGILLISPQGDILQLAVQLNFRATNNEAEYEALLAGLQAAWHIGAARVIIYSDSQLVTQQVVGNFEVTCNKLQIYREAYEKMKDEFVEVTVTKIPRAENEKEDELAKMGSSLTTWVLDRSMAQTFLIAQIDLQNNREATIDWRAPLISYLLQGTLSADPEESRLVRKQAHAYVMIGDQLYKSHVGGRTLARRVLLAGYFWPTLQRDAQKLVNTCLSCQKHQNLMHRPTALLRTSIVSCPFDQWSMDIVGPFPIAPGQKRFLLVAVDYFSKWVEAEALVRITEGAIIQFLWKNILCRFDIPHKLVSDNGRQFQGQKIQAWCKGFGLTPFHLIYGNEAVVPIEIGVSSVRKMLYDEGNAERRLAELDLISEIHERTAARLEAYRQRMRQNYNRRVIPRFFGEGDLVWKQVKPMKDVVKIAPQWDGPYKVIKKLLSEAYYLQDNQGTKLDWPWSANYLRPYQV
ncbi:uncharacterized protein LOC122023266 [Zingiber officinale]|uniref:uncharacterized protein LOC122023266 n=1 Tax=Zingiber officinale TaxID=94328 RepID=UPI001C4B677B|nr:uncharacterized protein LOC122023266 [Zingiber officinale]